MTQRDAVIKYINDFGSITPFQAYSDLGITKLATIISNLRLKEGMEIIKTSVTSKNRYGNICTFMKYSFPEQIERREVR